MSAGPRVLLLTLSERTSAKGNAYLSGWLGKASVVAFRGEDDKHGNPTWDLFVSTPEPKPEQRQQAGRPEAEQEREVRSRPEPSSRSAGTAAPRAAANQAARHVERGDGWHGSSYRRPANGARRAPAADDAPFYDDSLENIGR